jgi:CRISPR-associated protein Csm5
MRYRLTCLTPLLVGDGRKLAPIDYMVWKDHVNVLDQRRIFRLLAKGPRLDGYLQQLKRADKLDFASWGGFAQNFADRRIPFENPAYAGYWNRAMGDSLHIPTFATGASGPYLPGTAIKGALRTGMVASNWKEGMLRDVAARFAGERTPRRPAEAAEE